MILDRPFAAPGHKDHRINTGGRGFFHRKLDDRLVDKWWQFFGIGFGSGQKAGAKPGF